MEPIRVLIVDDHPMVRHGLSSVLAVFPDIHIVGEAEDGHAVLQAARDLAPDIILLDIQLGAMDGIAVAGQLRKEAPRSKVIILTAYDNDDYVVGALRAGAFAYVLKSSPGECVAEAIRQVYQGKRLVSPAVMDRVLEQFQNLAEAQAKDRYRLADEELRVLAMIAHGATTEEIAEQMYWGPRTVRRRVNEIVEKMGARNRAQAIAIASKEGLI